MVKTKSPRLNKLIKEFEITLMEIEETPVKELVKAFKGDYTTMGVYLYLREQARDNSIIKISHTKLSEALFLTRPTVSLSLQLLDKMGYLKKSYGIVKIIVR